MVTKQAILETFRGLTTDAKLELLYRLWDELSEELEKRSATDAERRFIDERLGDIASDPRPARHWEDVRGELLDGK